MDDNQLVLIKKLFDKHYGDREEVAKELGVTTQSLSRFTRRIYQKFKDFPYHSKGDMTCDVFPTNEERLYYKDWPEVRCYKGRLAECLRNKKTED